MHLESMVSYPCGQGAVEEEEQELLPALRGRHGSPERAASCPGFQRGMLPARLAALHGALAAHSSQRPSSTMTAFAAARILASLASNRGSSGHPLTLSALLQMGTRCAATARDLQQRHQRPHARKKTVWLLTNSKCNLVKVAFCRVHVPGRPGDKSRSALCKTICRHK
jgi:hypothetical protein